ncbi:hypothetical protein NL108_014995 [Boleophthalmus pectinirostris]|nr:hypothetical protein NL108_014995 [Boleophthalmus pectinirostris]
MDDRDEENKENSEFRSAPGRSQRRRSQSLRESVGGSRSELRGDTRRSSSMMTPPFLRLRPREGESPERSRGHSKDNRRSRSREEPKTLCPSDKSAQHKVFQDCEGNSESHTEIQFPELSPDSVKNSPDGSVSPCLLHSPGPGHFCVWCGSDPNSSNGNRKKNHTTPEHKEDPKHRRRALRFNRI